MERRKQIITMTSRASMIVLFIMSSSLFVDSAVSLTGIKNVPSSSTSFGKVAKDMALKLLRDIAGPGDEIDYFAIFRNMSSSSSKLQPGQSFPNANVMKLYLQYLRYLKKTRSEEERSNNNVAEDDKFTSDLETALKKFQTTYGLPVTGQPDNNTVSLMKLPRCGVLDTMSSPFRWPWPEEKKELTYGFLQEDKMTATLKAVFSRAFARWEKATGLTFHETESSVNESDIRIVFWRWNAMEVVALSSLNDSSRGMYFDVDEDWGPAAGGMDAGEVDLETAAMHQIGHMLGFGHTNVDETAVMFPFMERGKRKLSFGTNESVRIQQFFNITPPGKVAGGRGSAGTSGGGCEGPAGWVLWLGIAFCVLSASHEFML